MITNLDTIVFVVLSFVIGIGFALYGAFIFVNKRGATQKNDPQFHMLEGKSAQFLALLIFTGGGLLLVATWLAFSQLNLAMFLAFLGGCLSLAGLGLGVRRRFD